MHLVNGAQFLKITFLTFGTASCAAVFGTILVPLTRICVSL